MTTQYAESYSFDVSKSRLLSQELRINLLGLKQFEQCYILARWIRKLFTDILEKSNQQSGDHDTETGTNGGKTNTAMQPRSNPSESAALDISHMLQFDRTTNPSTIAYAPTIQPNGNASDIALWGGHEDSAVLMPADFLPLLDFPSPSSLEYQGLQFLADLGFAGFNGGIEDS